MNAPVYFTGFAMGLSLIVAIGAQNAFILRQGLRKEHILPIILICAISDVILIFSGVLGFGTIVKTLPLLDPVMRYAGAAFLFWYGFKSLKSALRSSEALMVSATAEKAPLGKTLLACLALTWLNPHVYLDTVVLLGTISTHFKGAQLWFAAGASTGSIIFFFSLGYGARLLRPVFAKPLSWRVLDGGIAAVMGSIAVSLVAGA